jgi:hypothetical protein
MTSQNSPNTNETHKVLPKKKKSHKVPPSPKKWPHIVPQKLNSQSCPPKKWPNKVPQNWTHKVPPPPPPKMTSQSSPKNAFTKFPKKWTHKVPQKMNSQSSQKIWPHKLPKRGPMCRVTFKERIVPKISAHLRQIGMVLIFEMPLAEFLFHFQKKIPPWYQADISWISWDQKNKK